MTHSVFLLQGLSLTDDVKNDLYTGAQPRTGPCLRRQERDR